MTAIMPPYYGGSMLTALIQFLIIIAITCVLSLFSPFGIGFLIFSFIKQVSSNLSLKKASFVFQIILSLLNFLLGLSISIYALAQAGRYGVLNFSNSNSITGIAVLLGVLFIFIVHMAIIVWQSMAKEK